MAYRYGNRYQFGLFPQSIEDYVAANDPVRAYDAFVEALDFNALGGKCHNIDNPKVPVDRLPLMSVLVPEHRLPWWRD